MRILKELQETYNIFLNHIIDISKGKKNIYVKERRYYGIMLIILSIIIMLV